MNKQFSSQFKYWPIILAVLFGAIFCPKTPKNNQFPYIPQDYYPVKIEYIDAPDEIKFSTDLEWADFVNSWKEKPVFCFSGDLYVEKNAGVRYNDKNGSGTKE